MPWTRAPPIPRRASEVIAIEIVETWLSRRLRSFATGICALQRPRGRRGVRSPEAKHQPFQMLFPVRREWGCPGILETGATAVKNESGATSRASSVTLVLIISAPSEWLRQRDISVKMKNLATVADFWPSSPVLFEGADLLAAQIRAIFRSEARSIRRTLG